MLIRAAVTRAVGAPLSIESVSLEAPRDHELIVKLVACGICQTDVAMHNSPTRVPRPIVLGHEGSGIVVAVGSAVRKVKPGDHVVMTFNSCGQCPTCRQGIPAYCAHSESVNFSGQRADGSVALNCNGTPVHSHFFGQSAFATHALCTELNVVPLRQDVPLELMGPFGCGIQTGAGAVLNSLKVASGSTVAIFGVGSVGLAAIMAARIAGAAKIVAVDTQDVRLAMAEELGATHTILSVPGVTATDIKTRVGSGLDCAIDTSGNVGVIRLAVDSLATLGTCGLISSAKGADISLNVLQLMLGGRTVRGIVQGDSVPDVFIPYLVDLYLEGRFPVDRIVSYYEFDRINEAVADMASGKAIKPIVRMAGTA
ncbi:MAG: NAD(P)-dependent alcohol dehydrogenase [Proteobacteria bacterium]|nr:NAD(P)-dependent alcohol dehydrogenase [Pseudomonadota bacterium]